MKKCIVFLLSSILLVSACGDTETKSEETATPDSAEMQEGMITFDLSSYGLPLLINVPDTNNPAAGKPVTANQPNGETVLKFGKDFQLSVQEASGELLDLNFQKEMIKSDPVDSLKEYVIEEPEAILYRTRIVDDTYHFYVIRNIGKTSYVVKDVKEEKFDKQAAEKMFNAARSLREKVAN